MPPADRRPTLSVCMVVRDAQDDIVAALQSVRPIADSIVVVDTGSIDDTIERARTLGATVVERPWDNDFSAARNHALNHVAGDWILWLDSAETITAETAAHLRDFVNHRARRNKAYALLVQVPAAASHKNLSPEQAARIRLLPARNGIQYSGRICERLQPALREAAIGTEVLGFRIHRNYGDQLPETCAAKARRNLRIAARETAEGMARPEVLVATAEAHAVLEDHDTAARVFRQAIDASQRGTTEMLEAYYGLLASFDKDPAGAEEQIATCLKALDVFPLDAQLLCAMGGYLLKQRRLDLASRAYEIAVNYGQINPYAWHLTEILPIAAISLSLTLQLQGQDAEAEAMLAEFLERHPEADRARRHMLELHIKHGAADQALAIFDQLPASTPFREALRSAVRGALLATAKNWTAARSYLETAFAAGCRDPLCLRWLAITYLALGQHDRARPILETWQVQDPDCREVACYLGRFAEQQARGGTDALRAEPAAGGQPSKAPVPGAGLPRHIRIDAGKHDASRRESPGSPVHDPRGSRPLFDPPASV